MRSPNRFLTALVAAALVMMQFPLGGRSLQADVPESLGSLGDGFLNGSDVGNHNSRQEPVPLALEQIPGFLGEGDRLPLIPTQEPWGLDPLDGEWLGVEPLPLVAAPPQILAQVDSRQSEADRLFNRGVQQYNTSQYQAALESWQAALAIYREIGDRGSEGDTLNALGVLFRIAGQPQTAIDLHQQALEIAREVGDQEYEGRALSGLGNAYFSLGQYERAIDLHQQQLEIAREISDLTGESRALGNLGVAYGSLGQYERAIDLSQQHLAISREIGDRAGESRALSNLGNTYNSLGQYERAIDFHEQHLTISREIGDRAGEGSDLGNLGIAYLSLSQYERAIDLSQQHLVITREIGDRAGESRALGNLGIAYFSLGQYERAIDFHAQDLEISREIGDRAGESSALGNLGIAYRNLGQYERAIDLNEQHLEIAREIGDRAGEGLALGNLGNVYRNLGQYERALEQYGQAVALFDDLGARSEESLFLSNIGKLLNVQAQPELAIIFLKASVDVREEIRGDIRGLSTDLQQSFTDTVAGTYRLLADLLLQQDRIIEAQRVLDLLKVQELDDYLQDVQRNAQTETGVDYWQPEADLLALYDEVLLAGTELARLQDRDPDTLTPAELARLQELEAQQNRLYTSFIDWLDHPEIFAALDQLRIDTRSRTVDIDNFTDLQTSLQQLPQTSIILYPLVLDDRLELVLVSGNAPPVRYPIAVDAITLNRAVVALGQSLKDRNSDPRPTAQQLYEWVIAPLEDDLTTLGVENIIFAPDGVLRYVPLAALYDGDQWLAERFSFTQITAASETDFAAAPSNDRTLLAAACAACSFSVNVGDDTFNFGDLPATRQEVALLADQIPGAQVLIDHDFTPDQFQGLLSRYSIIHLATHGLFVSGAPDESFLLFGDGQSVNLRQIRRDWAQLDADLVVLSACETALGSAQLGNGVEVLGLGFQLQRVGAKAVVASLWQVSDRGTQALMTEFYAALEQGLTKTAALQAAQRALIANQSVTTGGLIRAGAPPVAREGAGSTARAFTGYSHPYYWAPFILIGNGL
ncbi:MAG: CHAT domain-containing protein [Leptolyngbyaceae cyanobacterium]